MDSFDDEVCLLPGIVSCYEVGLLAGFSYWFELFSVAGGDGLAFEDVVCEFEDFRSASIVGDDFVDLGSRVSVGERHDVFEVCASPGVDALGVVAYGHDVVVLCAEPVNDVCLDDVCVLVFVDEDDFEFGLVFLGGLRVIFEEV